MSSEEYLSIEQVALRLQLHVRTVRAYVRSGRLKAIRVGKQYRIAREDLEAFTGTPATALPTDAAFRWRHTEVISIVQIDVIDEEEAARVVSAAKGTASGWLWPHSPLEIMTRYDQDRKRLKLILAGDLHGVAGIVDTIELLAGYSKRGPPRRSRR